MSVLTLTNPNETALDLTGRDYLSWSQVDTYRQCPLRYCFRYLEGLPEAFVSSSLAFGGSIHAAIELHFRELLSGSPPPDHDILLNSFWDSWQGYQEQSIRFGKGEDLSSIGALADRVLEAFSGSDLARPTGTILGVEEEMRGELVPGVPDLLGRVDLVVEREDRLVLIDFKTARSRWSSRQAEDSAEQLLLYAELARELAADKPIAIQFAVITKAKEPAAERYDVTYDRGRVERTKRVVERVWQAIEAGHFYPAPSAMNCGGCPFREACRQW